MKKQVIGFSLLLIALTNLAVITIDGFSAPITVFILYTSVIICFVLVRLYTRFPLLDKPEVFILAGYLFFVNLINIDEARWSSLGYSILYCVFFLFLAQYQHLISKEYFQRLSKIIIYLYLINVLLAHVFFQSLPWLFQGVDDARSGGMKYQGFSSEPSYAAFVVLVAFLIYIRCSEDTRTSKAIVLLSVIYLIKSFSSVYGYIIFGAIVLDWLRRNMFINPITLLILLFATGSGFLVIGTSDIGGESRVWNLFYLIISGDFSLENLKFLDSSAFMRIGPLFSYLEGFDLFSMKTYLGYGSGQSAFYFGHVFNDVIGEENRGFESGTLNLGFFPGFLYDYGIIGVTLVYLIVLRHGMCKFISIQSFIIFLMLFNASFNTQLFWYVWAMLFVLNQILCRTSEIDMRVNNLNFNREVL